MSDSSGKPSTSFTCDLCASRQYQSRHDFKRLLELRSEDFEIVQCTKCRLVGLFPHPPQDVLDDFYRDYGSKKDRLKDEIFRKNHVYPGKLDALKRYAPGRRLLDIGAGMGTFVHIATERGFDATGIELSTEQCEKAKELYDIDLLNCNLYETVEDLGKFDVIHLHHVMEHLVSPARMLKIAFELLNGEGVILIEVPYQLPIIQDRFRRDQTNTAIQFNLDHLYFFTPRTVKRYLQSSGFTIIKFSQTHLVDGHEPRQNPLRWILRTVFRRATTMAWVPSSRLIEIYARKRA